VSRYQKGKTNLDWILPKQETVSGSGISWAICKSAPRSRQITTPALHHSVFTDWMPFLPPNQQRQSTEGNILLLHCYKFLLDLFIKDKTAFNGFPNYHTIHTISACH